MSKEEQIEEMAKCCCFPCDMYSKRLNECLCGTYNPVNCLTAKEPALRLAKAGYGNLKEFVLRLKRKIQDEGFDELCQDCSASQQMVFDYIDDLLKEYLNG